MTQTKLARLALTVSLLSAGSVLPVAAAQSTNWDAVSPKGQTINFWHQLTGNSVKVMDQLIASFNKTNPYGITVKGQFQGNYTQIYQKIVPLLGTPALPDLTVAYSNQAATYQLADALVDLNPLIKSRKWGLSPVEINDFYPGIYKADVFPVFGGQRLGFPVQRSAEVMYYNSAWLKELGIKSAPSSPEQFKSAACKASKTPFSKAKGSSIGYELSVDASRFASWSFAFGGDIYDEKDSRFTLNNPGSVQAMTFLQGLFKDGCAKIVSENYGDQTDFGAGKLLFSIGSSSGLPFYKDAVDKGAAFTWNVAALPHTTTKPTADLYGASVSLVDTGDAKRELAAWLFVKYWSSPDVQAQWAKGTNYFPTRKSVAAKMNDYFTANPASKNGFALLRYAQAEPAVPGYDAVRAEIEKSMTAIMNGAAVKTTLDTLNKTANTILADQLSQIKK
ncbi:extracellular solute-binding protein [Deinococcus rubellus]|uniref:ABC transporter substrate-binding protein n=1 Tax=Deinococcus rubellus TaxID=1889240 RepID=A0ABY5YJ07_9DEIO|nr:ABC transporter substrate-binding protein [Deinococcus rubellus]UWX64795.1 ABC transporter substrate-binding protein [Deinococcus rubellus]